MKNYIVFLILCVAEQCITSKNDSFKPLAIFHNLDANSYEISDLKVIKDKKLSSQCNSRIVLCCPSAENFPNAQTKNVFTVKGIFHSVDECTTTCPVQYRPSVLHVPHSDIFKIGYEIFTEFKDEKLQNVKNDLQWKTILKVYYNNSKVQDSRIGSKHRVTPGIHSDGEPKTCPDLLLGNEHFNGAQFDELYNPKNLVMTPHPSPKTEESDEQETEEETTYELIPHQLTPIGDFDAESFRLATCTYMNTVPLWKSISEGSAAEVENFIRTVVNRIGEVHVWTGTYDILKLPFIDGTSEFEKIKIPRILYKVVIYQVKNPVDQVMMNCLMIIVIHNEYIKLEEDKKICDNENFCETNGWDVENDDVETGQTYCCEPTQALLKKLMIDDIVNVHNLNLFSLPIVTNNGRLLMVNVHDVPTDLTSIFTVEQARFYSAKIKPLTILFNTTNNIYLFLDIETAKDVQFSPLFTERFTHIIFCCPAETDEEKKFQKQNRLTNVLFIRNVFYIDDSIENYSLKCINEIQPRIFRDRFGIYDFGYQIRFEKEIVKNYMLRKVENFKYITKDVYFLNNFFVHYNFKTLEAIQAMYTVTAAMHCTDDSKKCENFFLGQHFFKETGMEELRMLYSQQNQKLVFNNLDLSALEASVQLEFRNPSDESTPPYGCLVKHQLIPIQDYSADYLQNSTCTNLNVVPVWEKVEGVLEKVESFIQKVADVVGEVIVTTGTHGVLDFSKSKNNKIYLHTHPYPKKIPVPKILWKYLCYIINIDDVMYYYDIVVITHNEPDSLVHKICKETVPKEFGWGICDMDLEIGSTYCCWINQVSELELELEFVKNSKPFDLRQVPVYFDKDRDIMRSINVLEVWNRENPHLDKVPALNKEKFIKTHGYNSLT